MLDYNWNILPGVIVAVCAGQRCLTLPFGVHALHKINAHLWRDKQLQLVLDLKLAVQYKTLLLGFSPIKCDR